MNDKKPSQLLLEWLKDGNASGALSQRAFDSLCAIQTMAAKQERIADDTRTELNTLTGVAQAAIRAIPRPDSRMNHGHNPAEAWDILATHLKRGEGARRALDARLTMSGKPAPTPTDKDGFAIVDSTRTNRREYWRKNRCEMWFAKDAIAERPDQPEWGTHPGLYIPEGADFSQQEAERFHELIADAENHVHRCLESGNKPRIAGTGRLAFPVQATGHGERIGLSFAKPLHYALLALGASACKPEIIEWSAIRSELGERVAHRKDMAFSFEAKGMSQDAIDALHAQAAWACCLEISPLLEITENIAKPLHFLRPADADSAIEQGTPFPASDAGQYENAITLNGRPQVRKGRVAGHFAILRCEERAGETGYMAIEVNPDTGERAATPMWGPADCFCRENEPAPTATKEYEPTNAGVRQSAKQTLS